MIKFYKPLAALALSAGLCANADAQANLTQSNFTGVIVPQYMGSGTTTRIPVAYNATVSGLTPSTTYRYYNQLAAAADLGMAKSGASNPILNTGGGNLLYSTSPKLRDGASGTFTTDASGSYTGWFINVHTGNSRFVAGADIIPTITINNGGTGPTDTAVFARYALDQTIKVLTFGPTPGATYGTGIYGTSLATAKNFVCLYDNQAGTGRPLAATIVESTGLQIPSLVGYYTNNVAGQLGAWGTILPNNLSTGVQNISQYSAQAVLVGNSIDASGMFGTTTGTVNPAGGATNAIAITSASAPLNTLTAAQKEFASSSISLYPTPATAQIYIQHGKTGSAFVIADVTGKSVLSGTVSNQPIAITSLVSGIYQVQVTGNHPIRFVKQ